MKTLNMVKKTAVGVALVAAALTMACGKSGKKGAAAAPVATAQCLGGECQVGQQTAQGMFQGRGVGRAYISNLQGQATMIMTVATYTNTAIQQQQQQFGYQQNYGQITSINGTVSVRSGNALMLQKTSLDRSPANNFWNAVADIFAPAPIYYEDPGFYYQDVRHLQPTGQSQCYNRFGEYICGGTQQTCYFDHQQGRQVCNNGGTGGIGGTCNIPVGEYNLSTTGQNAQYGYGAVNVTMAGPVVVTATISSAQVSGVYGNQIGQFSGSMRILTVGNQQCNTTVSIGSNYR